MRVDDRYTYLKSDFLRRDILKEAGCALQFDRPKTRNVAFNELPVRLAPIEGSTSQGAMVVHLDITPNDTLARKEAAKHLLLPNSSRGGVFALDQAHLDRELLRAQAVEAAERLSGGIAHDFKNALAVVAGYGHLLEERLDADDDGRRYAQQIGKAVERATAFMGQLLDFNRKELLTARSQCRHITDEKEAGPDDRGGFNFDLDQFSP
jgi:signal transduction histidine kinase